jgi:hypothetical protein
VNVWVWVPDGWVLLALASFGENATDFFTAKKKKKRRECRNQLSWKNCGAEMVGAAPSTLEVVN